MINDTHLRTGTDLQKKICTKKEKVMANIVVIGAGYAGFWRPKNSRKSSGSRERQVRFRLPSLTGILTIRC